MDLKTNYIKEIIMKILIGSDKYGFSLKESIKQFLTSDNIPVHDLGCFSSEDDEPYYEIASLAASKIAENKGKERAILICGTGMGMSIVANKYPGVYAAVCETPYAAEKSRAINNSNVLTLGEFITPSTMAIEIVKKWLNTEFKSGFDENMSNWLQTSMNKIDKIKNFHSN
jgi:ribose 5-phosphate isomerase B